VAREVLEEWVDRMSGPLGSKIRLAEAFPAEEAVDVLFRRHYPALLRVASAMLGAREAAEDAVQDAFVSATARSCSALQATDAPTPGPRLSCRRTR